MLHLLIELAQEILTEIYKYAFMKQDLPHTSRGEKMTQREYFLKVLEEYLSRRARYWQFSERQEEEKLVAQLTSSAIRDDSLLLEMYRIVATKKDVRAEIRGLLLSDVEALDRKLQEPSPGILSIAGLYLLERLKNELELLFPTDDRWEKSIPFGCFFANGWDKRFGYPDATPPFSARTNDSGD